MMTFICNTFVCQFNSPLLNIFTSQINIKMCIIIIKTKPYILDS